MRSRHGVFDDFFTVGIWVGLRMFMMPAIFLGVAYYLMHGGAGDLGIDFLAPFNDAMDQIGKGLGGQGLHVSGFGGNSGGFGSFDAKWLKP